MKLYSVSFCCDLSPFYFSDVRTLFYYKLTSLQRSIVLKYLSSSYSSQWCLFSSPGMVQLLILELYILLYYTELAPVLYFTKTYLNSLGEKVQRNPYAQKYLPKRTPKAVETAIKCIWRTWCIIKKCYSFNCYLVYNMTDCVNIENYFFSLKLLNRRTEQKTKSCGLICCCM